MTQQYDVFLFHLPEVSSDGKSILGPESQTKRFDDVESAWKFAEQNCGAFNRITINLASPDKPTLVGRFDDGVKVSLGSDPQPAAAGE